MKHRSLILLILPALLCFPLFSSAQTADICIEATKEESPSKRVVLYSQCILAEHSSDSNLAIAYYGRGQAYIGIGELEKARLDYSKAIEYNPNYSDAYLYRGALLNELHEYGDAVRDFDKVISFNPGFAKAYSGRGFALFELGLYSMALSDFDKIVVLTPGKAASYRDRGFIHERMGNYTKAIADYTKVLEINTKDGHTYSRLGYCYYQLGNHDLALKSFNEAIQINPENAETYAYQGLTFHSQGKYQQAADAYSKALQISPDHALTLNNYAWLLITAKLPEFRNVTQALDFATKAVKLTEEKNPSFLDTLAAVYAALNQFDNAVQIQTKAVEIIEKDNLENLIVDARRVLQSYKQGVKYY